MRSVKKLLNDERHRRFKATTCAACVRSMVEPKLNHIFKVDRRPPITLVS